MANSQELANYSVDVKDVIIDPRQPLSAITFTLPIKTASSKINVITASASVVMEAFSDNTELKYITVRCLTTIDNSSSPQIVFCGGCVQR